MLKWLGLAIFVSVFVGFGVLREKNRTAVHFILLIIITVAMVTTCKTAVTHYREVNFLKTLDLNCLVRVAVGESSIIEDPQQLQNVVSALRTPEDFLASRSNHGEEAEFTIELSGGTRKVFTISRAVRTRGAVVRIRGGGTVLYKDLEWLIPKEM